MLGNIVFPSLCFIPTESEFLYVKNGLRYSYDETTAWPDIIFFILIRGGLLICHMETKKN